MSTTHQKPPTRGRIAAAIMLTASGARRRRVRPGRTRQCRGHVRRPRLPAVLRVWGQTYLS